MTARIVLHAVGVTPLLTHNPLAMSGGGTTSKGKNIPSPEEEAERGVYRDQDGRYCIPGISFRNAIIRASGAWKAQRGKGTLKGAMSHIMFDKELVPILDAATGEPIQSYAIDVRRAVVQRNGVLRARPRFDNWAAKFTVVYDENLISGDIIPEIARDAGQRIGVGDYRPERTGWFGRFDVRTE